MEGCRVSFLADASHDTTDQVHSARPSARLREGLRLSRSRVSRRRIPENRKEVARGATQHEEMPYEVVVRKTVPNVEHNPP